MCWLCGWVTQDWAESVAGTQRTVLLSYTLMDAPRIKADNKERKYNTGEEGTDSRRGDAL